MIELMEETANMLRGMCMDPRIPQDTKEALWSRVRKLDAATEAAADVAREWVESEESMRGAPLREVLRSQGVTAIWHRSRPDTANPVWEVAGQ
jgi:hypothetical protein